jgi:hypothetical protein
VSVSVAEALVSVAEALVSVAEALVSVAEALALVSVALPSDSDADIDPELSVAPVMLSVADAVMVVETDAAVVVIVALAEAEPSPPSSPLHPPASAPRHTHIPNARFCDIINLPRFTRICRPAGRSTSISICSSGAVAGRCGWFNLAPMRTSSLTITLTVSLCAALACGGDKAAPAGDSAPKKADAPAAVAAPTADAADELHVDITLDKSGVIARAASTLETSEKLSSEDPLRSHLADASHHAERGPTNEAICRHIIEIEGHKDDSLEDCAKLIAHHRVVLGPEVFGAIATCTMAASTAKALSACDAAEKEAEALLHEKTHGDGLDTPTCEGFFEHFKALAVADAGADGEVVGSILGDLRGDLIAECMAQGKKTEVECAMAAKDMVALALCEAGA